MLRVLENLIVSLKKIENYSWFEGYNLGCSSLSPLGVIPKEGAGFLECNAAWQAGMFVMLEDYFSLGFSIIKFTDQLVYAFSVRTFISLCERVYAYQNMVKIRDLQLTMLIYFLFNLTLNTWEN